MDDSGEDRKYAIVVEGYDEPVGFTALYGLFRQTAPELGALIGDDVRGKGVGRRAEALTIAKAFDEFGAHRVYGRIPARNEIAKRTVAGLGWRHEGTMRAHLRRPDGVDDCEVWGVLPDEFRAAAADLLAVKASAELIADRGAAAESAEFFRSRPFLDAEDVTHTLRIETGDTELLAPLIVREIPGTDLLDAISPYGYPGLAEVGWGDTRRSLPAVAPAGVPPTHLLDPAEIDFSATRLVSLFIRHTLAEPPLAAAAERNVVQIADPALPPKSRSSDRNRINKNRRAGYEVELLRGPERQRRAARRLPRRL